MTNNNHPITPPDELVQRWATEYWGNPGETIGEGEKFIAAQAARWGADQELEACCEWLAYELRHEGQSLQWADDLRADRRPEPPSLKAEALEALKHAEEGWRPVPADCAIIRRALESLPD